MGINAPGGHDDDSAIDQQKKSLTLREAADQKQMEVIFAGGYDEGLPLLILQPKEGVVIDYSDFRRKDAPSLAPYMICLNQNGNCPASDPKNAGTTKVDVTPFPFPAYGRTFHNGQAVHCQECGCVSVFEKA